MQSARLKSPLIEPLRNLPLALASLFIVVVAVELLVKLQPAIVQSLRSDVLGWTSSVGVASPWATLFAASVSLVAVALTATALAGFANGVQATPYFALAPLLIGFSAFAIGAVPIDLPMAMDTRWFAAVSALLWLGGGVLMLGSQAWSIAAGSVVTAAPPFWLGIAYSQSQAQSFDAGAQQLMLVVVLASLGAPLMAFAERRVRAGRVADSEDVGEQLLRLVERAERGEARAAQAEQQLAAAGPRGKSSRMAIDDLAETMQLRKRRPEFHWRTWGLVALVLGIAASVYVAGYRPLHAELAATREQNVRAEQQIQILSQLGQRYERERSELEAQLKAARAMQVETVPAAAGAVVPRATSADAPQGELAPDSAATPSEPPARKVQRSSKASQGPKPAATSPGKRGKIHEAAPPAPAETQPAPADPAEGMPRMDDRSDDPLEGLDGLSERAGTQASVSSNRIS